MPAQYLDHLDDGSDNYCTANTVLALYSTQQMHCLLNSRPVKENSVDPDQLASSEAS